MEYEPKGARLKALLQHLKESALTNTDFPENWAFENRPLIEDAVQGLVHEAGIEEALVLVDCVTGEIGFADNRRFANGKEYLPIDAGTRYQLWQVGRRALDEVIRRRNEATF